MKRIRKMKLGDRYADQNKLDAKKQLEDALEKSFKTKWEDRREKLNQKSRKSAKLDKFAEEYQKLNKKWDKYSG